MPVHTSRTTAPRHPLAHEHGGREFPFTDHDFERIRRLIHALAGISLSPIKRDMVYSRLARRLRATGHRSFSEYLAHLETGCPEELEAFTNALTTNLTAFFREEHHFQILEDFLRGRMGRGQIAIWCAAASTGEEPYSIAMTVAELFGGIPPHVKILASDVDTSVLEQARAGIYPMERVQRLPQDLLRKYFLRGQGAQAGLVRVHPDLQGMITYRRINLLDDTWPMRGPFDVIFCRNVMIYFDKPTQRRVLEKFVPLLAGDGLLFAGHSESLHHASDLFTLRGRTVYHLAAAARGRGGR